MKVITAPEQYEVQDNDILVFLAGGISKCEDWQKEVIDRLKELDNDSDYDSLDHLVVINPRRGNFPIGDLSAAESQIKWEYYWLERCDIFSMYFADGESAQPICMYELGRNICRMQMRYPTSWIDRIIVNIEDGYKRTADVVIQTDLATGHKISPIIYYHGAAHHAHHIYRAYSKMNISSVLYYL